MAASLLAAALGACGIAEDGDEETATLAGAPSDVEYLREAWLGPLTYTFDDTALTPTEVTLAIPPGYTVSAFANKLIPAARAAQTGSSAGTPECALVDVSALAQCQAENESGLSLALLERPIGEYRTAFDEGARNAGRVLEAGPDGTTEFAYRVSDADGETEYRFLGFEDRTVLLVRHRDERQPQMDAKLEQVVASVRASLAERQAR